MGFITKTFSHLGGTFIGRLWETAAGGPLVTTSLPVDQWGTPIDFSQLPEIATEFRDMQMAAGTPEAIATGQKGQLQGDRYKVLRVSLAQGGREAPFFLLREMLGQQVFSNTGAPVLTSVGLRMDGRVNKPVADRTVNENCRINAHPDGVFAKLEYVGPCQLSDFFIISGAPVSLVVRLYDLAALPDEANLALTPPKYSYEIKAGETRDKNLNRAFFEKGLVVRITRGLGDTDKTALVAGDFRSFNLPYAR